MAAGRDVFQARGTCYLCGPSSFLIRREGPATIVLLERSRAEAICTTCGLDAAARAALHSLDLAEDRRPRQDVKGRGPAPFSSSSRISADPPRKRRVNISAKFALIAVKAARNRSAASIRSG